jgi:hypothetical protein
MEFYVHGDFRDELVRSRFLSAAGFVSLPLQCAPRQGAGAGRRRPQEPLWSGPKGTRTSFTAAVTLEFISNALILSELATSPHAIYERVVALCPEKYSAG